MTEPPKVQIQPGIIAVTTYGQIRHETVQSLLDMQRHHVEIGLTNIHVTTIAGGLVAKARNEACQQLVAGPAQWLLFLDGDMTWGKEAVQALILTAYHEAPHLDIVGGYCNLRSAPHLPTIDTGTGTWEPVYPGRGVVEVMRTGAAALLIKRHVVERMAFPWFGTRTPLRPIVAMYELDNFARQHCDGWNPFWGPEWERLLEVARQDAQVGDWQLSHVGEDTAFCDRAKAHGYRIGVNTNVVFGHVDTKVIDWTAMRERFDEKERQDKGLYGIVTG